MHPHPFTPDDLVQIRERSLTPSDLLRQLSFFVSPPPRLRLERPARTGDGVHVLDPEEADALTQVHGRACGEGRFLKFVPASGAATRMFDALMRRDPDSLRLFEESVRRFAFYEELESRRRERNDGASYGEIALEDPRPGLAHRPKGLLPFHRYPEGPRTPLDEHLVEAHHTVRGSDGVCRLHFTVSPEHRSEFESAFPLSSARLSRELGSTFMATFSVQDPSTETLAADEKGEPFRDGAGRLVFRPGGHGSLLRNLEAVAGDLVYLKNIDNVVPDRLKGPTLYWKRVLGGLLVALQDELHGFLRRLDEGSVTAADAGHMRDFSRRWFGRDPWAEAGESGLREWFHRPLRVCGMVPNRGEPGGGPFWVRDSKGILSLQIVEKAQVDLFDANQKSIFEASTHFNPVDLVCGLRDHRGMPFELSRYSDPQAVILTKKTLDGKTLQAFEWPGLWNGAMHGWLTAMVEVPLETFDPVKTVFDLLRPRHLSE